MLFAVPASLLAQFWSILGGNTLAAIIGISVALKCRTARSLQDWPSAVSFPLCRCRDARIHVAGAVALFAVFKGRQAQIVLTPPSYNQLTFALSNVRYQATDRGG
jgi:CBS domain-containing membrane protein